MKIGIDFDNTIVRYDEVFAALARVKGLLPEDFIGTKKAVRDTVRELPDGEISWQRLQGQVYGSMMSEAQMFDGVADFLAECRERDATVFIVSHKSEYANYDPDRVNLRDAARAWMSASSLFSEDGLGLDEGNVFFETTREEKIRRIADLGCAMFIDDLEEIFLEPAFPNTTARILFAPGRATMPEGPFEARGSWAEIQNDVFATAR